MFSLLLSKREKNSLWSKSHCEFALSEDKAKLLEMQQFRDKAKGTSVWSWDCQIVNTLKLMFGIEKVFKYLSCTRSEISQILYH